MKLKYLFIFIILFTTKTSSCNDFKIDSLKAILLKDTSDSLKSGIYNEIGRQYFQSNKLIANKYADSSLLYNKKLAFLKLARDSYEIKGNTLNDLSKHREAIQYFRTALGLSKRDNDTSDMAADFLGLGNIYLDLEIYDTANVMFDSAIHLGEQINDEYIISKTLFYKGTLMYRTGDLIRRDEYCFKGLEIAEKIDSEELKSYGYQKLGTSFLKTNDISKAKEYFKLYLESTRKNHNKCGEMNALFDLGVVASIQLDREAQKKYLLDAYEIMNNHNCSNLANLDLLNSLAGYYIETKEFITADKYYSEAILLAREINSSIGVAYLETNQVVNYMIQKKFKKAINLGEGLFGNPEVKKNLMLQTVLSENLKKANKELGNYKKAYEYSIKADTLNDSLSAISCNEKTLELQTKYETGKKEFQIQIQEEKLATQAQKNKNLTLSLWAFATTALLLLLGLVYLVRRSIKAKKREQQLLNDIASIRSSIDEDNDEMKSRAEFHNSFASKFGITENEMVIMQLLADRVREKDMHLKISHIGKEGVRSRRKKLYKKLAQGSNREIDTSVKAILLYRDELVDFARSKKEMVFILSGSGT